MKSNCVKSFHLILQFDGSLRVIGFAGVSASTALALRWTPRRCSKPRACHAKASAKAYIGPRADAPSPPPATQKQRQSGGAQNAPKRTSDPAQTLHAPRLPRKSSGRATEPKTRQSVHQCPRSAPSPRLPHKSSGRAAEPNAPKRTPERRQSVHRTPCSAPSPTPATPKQRQSGGAQNAPKRTSDPAQTLQAPLPRLPRKSSGRAAEPKTRQSVHRTPCRCSKPHACHTKAAAERRSPKRRQSVHQTPRRCSKPHACLCISKRQAVSHQDAHVFLMWGCMLKPPGQKSHVKACSFPESPALG